VFDIDITNVAGKVNRVDVRLSL